MALRRRGSVAVQLPEASVTGVHTAAARHGALGRLCSNHEAVAKFACRGIGAGRAAPAAKPVANEAMVAAVDGALLIVANLMMHESDRNQLQTVATVSVESLVAQHGVSCMAEAAECLSFLMCNVGVQRDMPAAPAECLREHLKLVATTLALNKAEDESK